MSLKREQLSDTVNRPSRDVWVRPDNARDLIDCVNAYALERRICIPQGSYNLGTEIINVPVLDGYHPSIIGVGSAHVTIISTGTKVFDVSKTAFVANTTVPLSLDGVKIRHNCANATDITLDLLASQVKLKDVWLVNINGTRQGTAIKAGKTDAVSPTGYPVTWKDVVATDYGIAFENGLHHSTLINCVANNPSDKGFYLHDTFSDSEYAEWIALIHCQTMSQAATRGTIYPFYFTRPVYCSVFGGSHEDATALTNNIFHLDQTSAVNYMVPVFGFTWHESQIAKICNDFTRVRFFGCGARPTYDLQGFSDFETIAGAGWVNPSATAWEGKRVVMKNTGAGQYRVYYYVGGAWRYVALT